MGTAACGIPQREKRKTRKETGARTGATGPEHNRETKEAASKTNKTENNKAKARGDLTTKEGNGPRTNSAPAQRASGIHRGVGAGLPIDSGSVYRGRGLHSSNNGFYGGNYRSHIPGNNRIHF